MLQMWRLTLWIFIFHNTWRRKSLTRTCCSSQEPHHSSATAAAGHASVLPSSWDLRTWSHTIKAPATALASTQDLCAVFERVSVHPMCRNMNILSLLPSEILLSVIRSKPCWINPFKASFHHSMSISVLLPSGEKSTSNNAESYLRNKLTKNVKATRNSLVIHRG